MDRIATRPLVIVTAFASSLLIGLLVVLWAMGGVRGVTAPAAIGGPFQLTDQAGATVTEKDLQGRPTLIFFGFTHCPDVCPTSLFEMSEVLRAMGKDADRTGALFITVDPELDTAAHLAEYLQMFHPRMIGLTGDTAAIRAAAEAYKVYYDKVPSERGDEYNVDHTAFIYLMGPDGKYLGFFPPGTAPERIAETLRKQIDADH